MTTSPDNITRQHHPASIVTRRDTRHLLSPGIVVPAVPATHLIAMYQRWGYVISGECDWRPFTNYPSVVMTRNTT